MMNTLSINSQRNSFILGQLALKTSENISWKQGIAISNEKLGRCLWNLGIYDSALYYHFKSKEQFKKLRLWKDYWDVEVMIGQDHANNSKFDSALLYLNSALNWYKKTNQLGGISYVLGMISWVYSSKGDNVTASTYTIEQLKIDESKKDSFCMSFSSHSLAEIYVSLGKYDEAESIADKWYPYHLCHNTASSLLSYYFIKAEIQNKRNKRDSVLYFLNQAKKVGFEINNLYWIGYAYSSIGNYMFEYKEYQTALENIDSAIYYQKKYNQTKELASLYCLKSKSYLALNNLEKAKISINEAFPLIKDIDSKSNLLLYYQTKYMIDSASKDWANAFHYHILYSKLLDSTFNNANAQKIYEMQMNYESNKREIGLKDKNKKTLWILLFVTILSLTILIFYYKLSVKNKKITKQNDIQKTMLHEIHHRVKNNLQLISSFMQLQLTKSSDFKSREALEESINKIKVVSLVHENLYKQTSPLVVLNKYISDLCSNINSINNAEIKPKIDLHIDNTYLNIDKSIPLGLLINELITNSIKYAFNKQEHIDDNKITIKILSIENEVSVLYQDNGSGFDSKLINKSSTGLKLIKMLVQELQGKSSMETSNGFLFEMKFTFNINKHS